MPHSPTALQRIALEKLSGHWTHDTFGEIFEGFENTPHVFTGNPDLDTDPLKMTDAERMALVKWFELQGLKHVDDTEKRMANGRLRPLERGEFTIYNDGRNESEHLHDCGVILHYEDFSQMETEYADRNWFHVGKSALESGRNA